MNAAALFCLCLLPPVDSSPPARDDLVLQIQAQQPASLRLSFEIDGKPLAAVWQSALANLFADLDRNADGVLDHDEAKRAPDALRLRQLGWNYLFAVPRAAAWDELDANHDNKITPAEFADYYQRHGLGKPVVGVGEFAPTAKLNAAFLKRLAGGDKQPDRDAWRDADRRLAALDIDSDEMIRPDEILSHMPYPGSFGGLALSAPSKGTPQPQLLRDLPVQLSILPTPAAATTTKEIVRSIGFDKDGKISVARPVNGPLSDPTFALLNDVHLAIYGVPGKFPNDWAMSKQVALQRFQEADTKRQGFVDSAATAKINFAPLRDHFAFADCDGDGKLTRTEWENYLKLRGELIACQLQVTLLDSGPSLFEALDADVDGALSVRELRNAWQRLESLGCTTKEGVDLTKLPRRIRFIISQGQPRTLTRRVVQKGPAWFLAMDRNNDGDVSRQEFLGDDAAFQKLDTNHDGLISREEAEKAAQK